MAQEAAVPKGFWARVQKMIDDAIAKSQRAPVGGLAVTGKSGVTIKNGGRFTADYPDDQGGGACVYVGDIYSVVDGSYQGTGLLVQAPDGTDLMVVRTDVGFGSTMHNIYDSGGRIIVGNDAASREGLARPWIPLPLPVTNVIANWPNTTSTSAANIAESQGELQHPKIWWNATTVADAGVTGTVQLKITYGSVTVFGASHPVTSTVAFIDEVITLPSGFANKNAVIDVVARVTGGTGKVSCQTWTLYNRQS